MTPEETPADVRERVRADGLLGEDAPIVTMLSGGRDSVCLLDVAVAVRGAGCVRALHVNYGLRGEASDADERHCARLCAQLGVELELVRVDEAERAGAAATGNLHAWARELRYRAAMRLAGQLDARFAAQGRAQGQAGGRAQGRAEGRAASGPPGALVATGHTSSDQLETILYRLAASPGRRALLGMAPREGRLIRPLLALTREQTAAYCRALGLDWREDASNDDPRYARARVRNQLLPALRAVHPAAERSVLRTAALLREEAELLDALVAEELAGRDRIAVARLAELHPALARLIVVRLAERAAGAYVPQAGARVREILALAGVAPSGRRGSREPQPKAVAGGVREVHVGGNVAARIEGGVLRMVALAPRA